MGGPARAQFVVGGDSIGAVVSQGEPDSGSSAGCQRPPGRWGNLIPTTERIIAMADQHPKSF